MQMQMERLERATADGSDPMAVARIAEELGPNWVLGDGFPYYCKYNTKPLNENSERDAPIWNRELAAWLATTPHYITILRMALHNQDLSTGLGMLMCCPVPSWPAAFYEAVLPSSWRRCPGMYAAGMDFIARYVRSTPLWKPLMNHMDQISHDDEPHILRYTVDMKLSMPEIFRRLIRCHHVYCVDDVLFTSGWKDLNIGGVRMRLVLFAVTDVRSRVTRPPLKVIAMRVETEGFIPPTSLVTFRVITSRCTFRHTEQFHQGTGMVVPNLSVFTQEEHGIEDGVRRRMLAVCCTLKLGF